MEVLGWREWVEILGVPHPPFLAKIDTGAKTSALHVRELSIVPAADGSLRAEFFLEGNSSRLSFPVEEYRWVRDSGGHETYRPMIYLPIRLGARDSRVLVSLTNRGAMTYAMLLGRRFLRRRFLVDPSRSYVAGTPEGAPFVAPDDEGI